MIGSIQVKVSARVCTYLRIIYQRYLLPSVTNNELIGDFQLIIFNFFTGRGIKLIGTSKWKILPFAVFNPTCYLWYGTLKIPKIFMLFIWKLLLEDRLEETTTTEPI